MMVSSPSLVIVDLTESHSFCFEQQNWYYFLTHSAGLVKQNSRHFLYCVRTCRPVWRLSGSRPPPGHCARGTWVTCRTGTAAYTDSCAPWSSPDTAQSNWNLRGDKRNVQKEHFKFETLKARLDWAKANEKSNFFYVCHLFFDDFWLFFDLFCFSSCFRLVWIGPYYCPSYHVARNMDEIHVKPNEIMHNTMF